MIRASEIAGIILIFSAIGIIYGKPIIEVSEKEFDAGTIKEGVVKIVKHEFTIKNTGDEPLVIDRVRTSCGCAVVDYDSIIRPGKSGIVEPKVDLTGFNGPVTKTVRIFSNAENEPELKLVLYADIQPAVTVSPNFIRMNTAVSNRFDLTLTTEKRDLAITEIDFRNLSQKNKRRGKNPLTVGFTLINSGKREADGMYTFDLTVSVTGVKGKSVLGEFIMKTNHPDKRELRIRGIVENKKIGK